MVLFNSSLDIGSILGATTSNMTGDQSLTYLLVIVLLLLIAMLFREPFVLFGLLVLPLVIVFAVDLGTGSIFYTILCIIGIFLAWQFAKVIMGWGR